MKFRWRTFGSGKKSDGCSRKGLSEKIVNSERHGTGAARLEEVFFDSKVWLDSDVEDFYSVNGDLPPSCGSTPIHPSSAVQTQGNLNADKNLNVAPAESPSERNKRLSDLFGDSFSDERNTINNGKVSQETYSNTNEIQKSEHGHFSSQKSVNESPYASVTSSICSSTEKTPMRSLKPPKYKFCCSSPSCLPSLPWSLSFGLKRKRLVPAHVETVV